MSLATERIEELLMKTIALNSATLIQQITSSAGVVAVRQVFFVLFVFFVVISDSMSYC